MGCEAFATQACSLTRHYRLPALTGLEEPASASAVAAVAVSAAAVTAAAAGAAYTTRDVIDTRLRVELSFLKLSDIL